MVHDSAAAEAGLLSDAVFPSGEAHRHAGQCGVCPPLGVVVWGPGGARTKCFSLQKGLNCITLQIMFFKCNKGGLKANTDLSKWTRNWSDLLTLYTVLLL